MPENYFAVHICIFKFTLFSYDVCLSNNIKIDRKEVVCESLGHAVA
jgi:hypothetical protein